MADILLKKSKQFQEKISNAPQTPGCYVYMDEKGKIIYVGKAKNILHRVKSYFLNYPHIEIKTNMLVDKICDVNFYAVDTEVESLILENNLIKKYRPKYNILMRDDKSYIYVRFEKARKSNQPIPTKYSTYQDFPRITIVREKKDDKAEYFGPYPSTAPINNVLKRLRRVFPYRTTTELVVQVSDDPLVIKSARKKPCFYDHIGLCGGACAGLESKQEYLERFNNIRKFFMGEKKNMIDELKVEMDKYAKEQDYETAAKFRDKIRDIEYVTANIRIDNSVDDIGVELMKDAERANAISQLIEKLNFPADKLIKHDGFRIECYDISNIQGTNSTGSMVVSIDGVSTPKLYRRFRIKTLEGPDDFASHQEVLGRRFRQYLMNNVVIDPNKPMNKSLMTRLKNLKEDESFGQKPDLIIIDGGKGQLTAAFEVLKNFELENDIPIVGLAKREEEIFKLTEQFKSLEELGTFENKFKRIKLARRSESLFMVQRIRDEAHRFAKNYHKKLRTDSFLK